MTLFSNLNGFDVNTVKNFSSKYDKEDGFAEVDHCTYGADDNIFGVDDSNFGDFDCDMFCSNDKPEFEMYDGYTVADKAYNSIFE